MKLERDEAVVVMTMEGEENRFNPDHLDELDAALDEVAAMEGHPALVLSGEGKFFSLGLDLEWMGTVEPNDAKAMVERTMALLARLLTAPFGVVAAVNGHAFGAGLMAALASDMRVMREDRGYLCLPEVDVDLVFLPGMSALIQGRLTPQSAHEMMLTGGRFGGAEALRLGAVDELASEEALVASARDRAALLAGRNPDTVAGIKSRLYEPIVERLRQPIAA
ncbi:MAG: enoyl-CoA hydratase/isomerase family protein [Solirubrobacterales bacterium]